MISSNMKSAIISLILLCLLLASPALSVIEKRGVIGRDERWTREKGPYIITDDIIINEGARLVIGPGTHVYIDRPHAYDDGITQRDHADSFSVSIKVKGVLSCVGRPNDRIRFSPVNTDSSSTRWYGIVLDAAVDPFTEIAYTDIAGAHQGITINSCSPLIRNVVVEFNNVGIMIEDNSRPDIFNTIAAHNFVTGMRIEKSNPNIYNNIFSFNHNYGVWSDGISDVDFSNNCIYGNYDRNLQGCDPELGIIKKTNHNNDSVDYRDNLFLDPIFAGSVAESLAVERDSRIPSDKSRVKDTLLAKVLHRQLVDSTAHKRRYGTYRRYQLSPYSPCVNAGRKESEFRDTDESRNDMGIWGGPEFIIRE